MSEHITIKNLGQVIQGLAGWEAKLQQAAVYAIAQVGFAIEREAKNGWAPRHKKGTPTTAEPGGKPASITGNLRRSIHTEIRQGFGNYVVSVGPTMEYARAVEFGLPSWGGVNYPYMKPAYRKIRPIANRVFTTALNRKMRG